MLGWPVGVTRLLKSLFVQGNNAIAKSTEKGGMNVAMIAGSAAIAVMGVLIFMMSS